MKSTLLTLGGLAGLLLLTLPLARGGLLCLKSLPPGGVEFPNTDDTCPADRSGSNPLGLLFSDTGIEPFSFTGSGITTSGSYREVVYQELSGTLDFYIQFSVSAGALAGEVSLVNTGDFTGYLTEAGSISPVRLIGAGSISPSIDIRSNLGDTIGYTFLTNVTPGETSYTLAISTDATTDSASNIGLIGAGGGTQTIAGFEPTDPTPEPVTTIPLGILAMSGYLIRRRSTSRG